MLTRHDSPLVLATLVAVAGCSHRIAGDRADAAPRSTDTDDGGVASDGRWQSTASVLVSGVPGIKGLAVDGDHVFWSQTGSMPEFVDGTIWRVPKWGGPAENLCGAQRGIERLAVDDAHVYFSNYYGDTVSRVAKTGGAPSVVAGGMFAPVFVTLDDDHVYFTNNGARQIVRADKAGGGVRILVDDVPGPVYPLVDPSHVYWASWGEGGEEVGTGRIARIQRSGGEPQVIAAELTWPSALLLIGDTLYWVEDRSAIVKLDQGTEEYQEVYSATELGGLVVVDDQLVFADLSLGAIQALSLDGGSVTTLAEDQAGARLLSSDGTSIYWVTGGAINEADGVVWRLTL